jgi:hypothetical protein
MLRQVIRQKDHADLAGDSPIRLNGPEAGDRQVLVDMGFQLAA